MPGSGTRAGYGDAARQRDSEVHMAMDTLRHLLSPVVSPVVV